MFMDYNGTFSSIMERKEGKYVFREATYEFYRFYKEISKFAELNNSIGVKNGIYWTCE